MTDSVSTNTTRRRGRRPMLLAVVLGLTAAVGMPALSAQAASPVVDTNLTATLDAPPKDDPAAVAEYLKLLEEYRASNPFARVAAAAASGPCLSSVSVNGVSQGTTVSVYRKSTAPLTLCTNAAQSVYDNEYKPLVASAYEGQKWRDQLVCHIANAWNKTPWNLDSWRPNVGYNATVLAQCNP